MKASKIFELYKEEASKLPHIESVFSDSGLVNTYGILDFGFFPLGSGVFKKVEVQLTRRKLVIVIYWF